MIQFKYNELQQIKTNFARVLSKSSNKFLSQVCVEIFAKGFQLTATNLSETLVYRSKEQGGTPSEFLISPETLKRIVAGMKRGDSVVLRYEEEKLQVKFSNGMSLSYLTIDSVNYPETLSELKSTEGLDASDLIVNYRRAYNTASTDPAKDVLNSIFFDSEAHKLVATDGRRLLNIKTELQVKQDTLIPLTKVLKVSKIFEEESLIKVDHKTIQIANSSWLYQCQQVEGGYPNWRTVVPESYESTIDLSGCELAFFCDTIRQLQSDKGEHSLHWHDNKLIFAVNDESGQRAASIVGAQSNDSPKSFAVDPNFLLDALIAAHGDVQIHLTDASSPICISSSNTQSVIMPKRGSDFKVIKAHIQEKYGAPKAKETSTKTIQQKENPIMNENTEVSAIEEINQTIEHLLEIQAEAKSKADEAHKLIRDSQAGLKSLARQLKAYEKDTLKKLKEYQQTQVLISKLQKVAA
ncbi:DNA polymerase III, beta chain [Lentisphaera araneosa HTCC2155]|uniref:Beta sliding clamp n=1 Tax=Lentisphaera araneosa HTCC2155 TaxID=313628 RepID=A6DQ87_9BACT|nr:DNA polymerase III subunit beta [Lentisphaera araneosa]EDM26138.1 DNA polymerase III, beta chain [Lentisphaera araneosa HTCC2155]